VYLSSTTQFDIFGFGCGAKSRLKKNSSSAISLFSPLLYVPILTRLSLLELYPGLGIQYVRSPGTFARFIKINWSNHTALISLPSGVHKSFSIYSLTFLHPVSLRIKKSTSNTRSGFWRSFGVKPKVRGVAMNPVDHPHGGRTKAIKNPRTPWGKPTKLK
jgi:large subunit ribosomal protein L2